MTQESARFRFARGFTFVEILIVVAIIAVFSTFVLTNTLPQTAKARDGRRKSDLEKIRTAIEHYMDDHGCYPQVLACGSTFLRPYLQAVPCDPFNKSAYGYRVEPSGVGACPTAFALYASLENTTDPGIKKVGCGSGCGPGNVFNYGIAEGMILENFVAP